MTGTIKAIEHSSTFGGEQMAIKVLLDSPARLNPNDRVEFDHLPKRPPKRYSFNEAYVMMKQGKWMAPAFEVHQDRYKYTFYDGGIVNMVHSGLKFAESISVPHLIGEWEEVKP